MAGQPKPPRSKKKLFLFIGLTLTFIVAIGTWQRWVNATPEVDIPSPPELPKANAFDVYVAAGKVLMQSDLVRYASGDVMPVYKPGENIPSETRPCTSADRRMLLAKNAIALTLFREARKLKYREPVDRSRGAIFPHYGQFRNLAALVLVRGREHESQGRWRDAANDYLAVMDFGAAVGDETFLLTGWLMGQACEYIGRAGLYRLYDKLKANELRAVLSRLHRREKSRISLGRIFQQESLFTQAGLLETFERYDWVMHLSYQYDFDIASTDWKKVARLQVIGKRGFMDDYIDAMETAVRVTQLPYAKRQFPDAEESISWGHQPNFKTYHFTDARARASNALLTTMFALRAFNLERHRYPRTLNELVPRYLQQVPTDPFGSGEALRYKPTAKAYLLYSIGPDGIDDAGRVIRDKRGESEVQELTVKLESEGDMVAGINR